MKSRFPFNQPTPIVLSLTVAALLLGHSAQAGTFTYSRTVTNTSGTADQWDVGTNWDSAPVSATTTTLTFTSGALASGATIFTNNNTAGNFLLNHLNFTAVGPPSATTTPTYTISGGTLEFAVDGATAPLLTVEPTGTIKPTLTVSSILAGSAGLTKGGSGIVALSGANTFTGGLNISGGELRVGGNVDNAMGAANGAINLSNGATFRTTTDGGSTGTGRILTIGTGGGTLAASGFSTRTMAFGIQGSELLTLAGGSTVIALSGININTGGFVIGSGVVQFSNAVSLPATGSILINAAGGLIGSGANATLQDWLGSGRIDTTSTGGILMTAVSVSNLTNSQNVNLAGFNSLFLGVSGLINLGAANTVDYLGTITPADTTYRLGHGSLSLTFKISPTNALTGSRNLLVGNGTATGHVWLSASNNYSAGTSINNNARLSVSNNGALGSGTVSVLTNGELRLRDSVTVGNALTLSGAPTADATLGALHSLTGTNAYDGNITVATGSRIGAANTAGNSLTLNGSIDLGANGLSFTTGTSATFAGGDIVVTGAITGSGGIVKNNATGTLTLSNANPAWSGNTTVAGGALAIGNNSALGTAGTLTLSGSATVRSSDATDRTIARGFGTFAGTSAVYTFGATSGGTGNLAFASTVTASIGTSAARTFQVHNTTKFSMGLSGTGSSINKTGNGAMIMNGTSTYTGGTTVTAGTLGGNGTLSATGITSVLATGTIAPGDAGIGTFNTGAVTVAGTLAIEFNGANCDKLLSTGAVDLSGATLTVTSLGSFSGPYVIAQGVSVVGTMTVPPGYAVNIVGGNQAVLTQTGTPVDYAGWASANGVTGGVNGDSDHDGIPNGVEYGLNTNPAGSDGATGSYTGNVLTFNKRTATSANTDLSYRIEVSPDLGVTVPWADVGSYVQNSGSVISANIPNGPTTNFARLRVIVNP